MSSLQAIDLTEVPNNIVEGILEGRVFRYI